MVFRARVLALVFALLANLLGNAQPAISAPDCAALYAFRDGELVHIYDVAMARYAFSAQALRDLNTYTKQLQDVAFWHTSDLGQMKDAVVLVMNATVDLIIGGLKLNKATLAAAVAADQAKTTAAFVKDGIESGRSISEIANSLVSNRAQLNAEGTDGYDDLKAGVSVVKTQIEDVRKITEMNDQVDDLKRTISIEMEKLKRQALRYQIGIEKARRDVQYVTAVTTAIDQACRNPLAGSWSGGGGSGTVTFGTPGFCTYRTVMRVDRMTLSFSDKGILQGGSVQATMTESTTSGNCGSLGTRVNTFQFSGGAGVSGVSFVGNSSNAPSSALVFNGTFTGNAIAGNLVFSRTDAGTNAAIRWTISVQQTLTH